MNYLKKYRQEAGLARSSTAKENYAAAYDADQTPTKETVMYLNGMLPRQGGPTKANAAAALMKTPVRRQSPAKKTPSALKDGGGRSSQRQSVQPLTRVDTNMVQSSSRKSIKQQVSGQSKKGHAVVNEAGATDSFRLHPLATGTYSPFTRNKDAQLNGIEAKRHSFAAQKGPGTSSSKRVPTKSAGSAGCTGASKSATAIKKQQSASAGKKAASQSIFASVRKSQAAAPCQPIASPALITATTNAGGREYASNGSIFRQDQVTPKAAKGKLDASKPKTPVEGRKKSTNQQSASRKKAGRGRGEASGSPTASEKAVRDAMMKTTQKIYFPAAFKMPGSKAARKEAREVACEEQPQPELREPQPETQEVRGHVKRAVITLSETEEEQVAATEFLCQENGAAERRIFDKNSNQFHQNESFCEQPYYEAPVANQCADDRSFISAEGCARTDKDCSKLSSGGGRRSRKERSKGKPGRSAVTPHGLSTLKGQNSLSSCPADAAARVRMLPGSDSISLELNIKGMTEPNREFAQPETEVENQASATQQRPKKQLQQSNSFSAAMQRSINQKDGISPLGRNQTQNTSGQIAASTTLTQINRSNNGEAYSGALNAFVQSTAARSRTPLINAEVYSQSSVPNGYEPSRRLAEKIMTPVALHKKTISSTVLPNSVAQPIPVTPSKSANRVSELHPSALKSAHRSTADAAAPGNQRFGQPTRTLNNLTPVRNPANGGYTPTRPNNTFFERSRYANVTQPIDRASEALEKVNDVFRQISVGLFDEISMTKKPLREDLEGCHIFTRFINSFRVKSEQWDPQSLQTWASLQSFMLYSPNCQKICLEIQQIKKKVLRPHISHVQPHTYDALFGLRENHMRGFTERSVVARFNHCQPVRKLVTLVLVSINHLLPAQQEEQQPKQVEYQPQEPVEQQQQDYDDSEEEEYEQQSEGQHLENHVVTQEEIVSERLGQNQVVEEAAVEEQTFNTHAPQPDLSSANYVSGCQSHREHQISFAAISCIQNAKLNETTIFEPMADVVSPEKNNEEIDEKLAVIESHTNVAVAGQANLENSESATDQDEVNGDEEGQADVESSRGSAWPSETSRLTPHQSTYQMNFNQQMQFQQPQTNEFGAPNRPQQNIHNRVSINRAVIKPKEEPMTEVKRAPCAITHHCEEGDMFEDFSGSSSFNQAAVTAVQPPKQIISSTNSNNRKNNSSPKVKKSQQQPVAASATQTIEDIVRLTKTEASEAGAAMTKEERIAQLQAAQDLIQRQLQELMRAEEANSPKKDNEIEEEKSYPVNERASIPIYASPARKPIAVYDSPQKLSSIKATLAIRQESVKKEIDSIMGDSPSPSKQVERIDWTLVSPEKFALKLDSVPPVVMENTEEMSSHDLTAEEESKDQHLNLKMFVEQDEAGRLASQRDRMQSLVQENESVGGSSAEKPCSEIRLSFFSPTKLKECFVDKVKTSINATERFSEVIEKQERELQNQQTAGLRLQRRPSEYNGSAAVDSPQTRDRKYKQMQNEIFNKIQAQLQNM